MAHPPVYYTEQALLGALLCEPQRLTNVTGSGPDAFSAPAHAAVSAGIRSLSAPDPAETTDHAAVFALRARSAPGPAERTEHIAWLGKVLGTVPEGLRRITRYHTPVTNWADSPDLKALTCDFVPEMERLDADGRALRPVPCGTGNRQRLLRKLNSVSL